MFKQGGKDKDGKPTAPENPQTLNRYSYVENNPLAKDDPNGHCSGGSLANNFVSIFNGTCFQKGMFIMAHARTPGEWALGAFAAVGPSAAVALLTVGTAGLGLAAIEAAGLTTTSSAAATAASVTDKLQRYLLNSDHPVGGSKANWFEQALGYTRSNAADLAKQIVFDPSKAVQTGITEYGTKYNQVTTIIGANGKQIDVTFAWIRNNDGIVRLVTAIPTDK